MKIVTRFNNDPLTYYAMSIAATWAGVGSLMMGIEMAQKHGLLPFLLWSLGNTLACIVYGILAPSIPKLRDVPLKDYAYHHRANVPVSGVDKP